MGDHDHVPEPDPASFWKYKTGETKTISVEPFVTFGLESIVDTTRVTAKLKVAIEGNPNEASGLLVINEPCVMIYNPDNGEPLITITLRKVEENHAYFQITGQPQALRVRVI